MAPLARPARLILVPDVTPGRGLGHLQRDLALGEAWLAAGGAAAVLLGDGRPEIVNRVTHTGLDAIVVSGDGQAAPAAITTAAADAAWCVLDGYSTGLGRLEAARVARRVGLIDDHGRTGLASADLVVDHNPGATAEPYRDTGATVLAGARYTLLGAAHRPQPGLGTTGDRVVVVMGGSVDPATVGFVRDVVERLEVPAGCIDLVGLAGAVSPGSGVNVIGRDEPLAPVFRSARIAFSAAGSTTWELAAAGTPTVLVAMASNQMPVGEVAAEVGIARYMGPVGSATPAEVAEAVSDLWQDRARIAAMAERGPRLVDGRGAGRVVAALRAADIKLRPACPGDARQLFEWANEPQVRSMAFDSRPIAWEDHLRWLSDRLADEGSWLFLAEGPHDGPWAQVRFNQVTLAEVEIHVSVAASHRGRGLAAPLLVAATGRLAATLPGLGMVRARVKRDNEASARAFTTAGFAEVERSDEVRTFVWEAA